MGVLAEDHNYLEFKLSDRARFFNKNLRLFCALGNGPLSN